MKQLKLISAMFLVILLSCNNDDNQIDKTVNYIEIAKSALYGNGEEGIVQSNIVIKNENDWQSLMNQMNSVNNITNEFNETEINFDTYIVIAIFLEVKGNGYEIEIDKITENNTWISVSTIEKAFVNSVMTQPFCIVKILKTEKTIRFE